MKSFTQRLISFVLACTSLVTASWTVTPASAWDRGSVQTFAVLPEGVPKVEGLTVGGDGNVYVSTFDPTGPAAPSQLFVFDDNGTEFAHAEGGRWGVQAIVRE